ncbi:type II toxin-antitoxin system HipA family toxin [Lunatimonas salinarum]|uniref:type II toxin-antitoxin system HipA family toxin n=1 Tax=Lunatimonas salinarum TaxID=1774590 RepID=UPI001ADF5005|nr:type II toxin-antitoxin system HipA family toxin [Lunatimonas salinarum]
MKVEISSVKVGLDFGSGIQSVGRLAIRDHRIYFEFSEEFLQKGIEISPLKLSRQRGVMELPLRPFEGLAGVFADSLPDGWGRLLFDRKLRANGIHPSAVSSLDRLTYVGLWGLGALVYEPDQSQPVDAHIIDLDLLASQTQEVLKGNSEEVLNELLALNGSSAGARPKALIGLDDTKSVIHHGAKQLGNGLEPWIVKFHNTQDGEDAGAIEYCYAIMAKEAGIAMPDTHLFNAKKSGAGYFAVKRFDRIGSRRQHMHTVAGLLHSDFRTPSLDYEDLLNLTGALTKDIREVEKMFRLAVFNVLAHNRDDHAKNFSFLMDHSGAWKLAPGYDLTFSGGPSGEQSTLVYGEGKNPGIDHLTKLAMEANLSKTTVINVIDQTQTALRKWESLASEFGVSKSNILLVSKFLRI